MRCLVTSETVSDRCAQGRQSCDKVQHGANSVLRLQNTLLLTLKECASSLSFADTWKLVCSQPKCASSLSFAHTWKLVCSQPECTSSLSFADTWKLVCCQPKCTSSLSFTDTCKLVCSQPSAELLHKLTSLSPPPPPPPPLRLW